MRKKSVLIAWPLTPFTGWGNYAIQIAKKLIEKGTVNIYTSHTIDTTDTCDFFWRVWASRIQERSKNIIEKVNEKEENATLQINCDIVIEALGNYKQRQDFKGKFMVGVIFFERSEMPEEYIELMKKYDLIITGSKWNQMVLKDAGLKNTMLIHQGIDYSSFNGAIEPKLVKRSLVIFAGGKLEIRKGHDIVIEAYKKLIKDYPDALLIACWANLGGIGDDTMVLSRYIERNPRSGNSEDIEEWIEKCGIPKNNYIIPKVMKNRDLVGLIKQSDTAVFMSRCEGGTNLMAMETLACGVPTVLSSNTGHIDLIESGIKHIIGIKGNKVDDSISRIYGGDNRGIWGEVEPDELVKVWIDQIERKEYWKRVGREEAKELESWTWERSIEELAKSINL